MTSDIEVAILRLLKMGRGGEMGLRAYVERGGGYQRTIKLLTNSQELHFLRYPREERVRVP